MPTFDLAPFLKTHRLPEQYSQLVETWFYPIAENIALHYNKGKTPLVVGINGAQGSGKSTLAALLSYLFEHSFNLNAVSLSIDDFYHTKATRNELAKTVHPLMSTRGVPGTHDTQLAIDTIKHLLNGDINLTIPRFNKATDDRHPSSQWDKIEHPVDIIIFEGWCVGAEAEHSDTLITPINQLETDKDPDGIWRYYVNQQLSEHYPALFNLIDEWIMLKAPSFACVYNWRLEQEHKLRQTLSEPNQSMNDQQVLQFIQHYQRITESILKTLPAKVDYLLELDANRQIISAQ